MTLPDPLLRLAERARPLRAALMRLRVPIMVVALILFAAGTLWSLLSLNLSLNRLDLVAFSVLTLGLGLGTMVYSAVSLMLMARTAGTRIGLREALRTSARAQIAEALPLPGGAIVRTAALVGSGASTGLSAALVLGTGLLWIALASIAAGAILIPAAALAGWALLVAGLAVSTFALIHIARLGGPRNMVLTLLHRLSGLGLAALRLWLSFAVVKVSLDLVQTFPYALAAITGSASSLVPGGLGVSEALGALMARTLDASPQSAFLAVAINRITQFLGTALLAPFFEFETLSLRRAR